MRTNRRRTTPTSSLVRRTKRTTMFWMDNFFGWNLVREKEKTTTTSSYSNSNNENSMFNGNLNWMLNDRLQHFSQQTWNCITTYFFSFRFFGNNLTFDIIIMSIFAIFHNAMQKSTQTSTTRHTSVSVMWVLGMNDELCTIYSHHVDQITLDEIGVVSLFNRIIVAAWVHSIGHAIRWHYFVGSGYWMNFVTTSLAYLRLAHTTHTIFAGYFRFYFSQIIHMRKFRVKQ